MIRTDDRVMMTKGYKNIKGIVKETTDSPYKFYVICLDNGINIIAGPSSFVPIQADKAGNE